MRGLFGADGAEVGKGAEGAGPGAGRGWRCEDVGDWRVERGEGEAGRVKHFGAFCANIQVTWLFACKAVLFR